MNQQPITQLEFTQAMRDFKTMFPELDADVIETILRSNNGAVEVTIDQLLAMTADVESQQSQGRNLNSYPEEVCLLTVLHKETPWNWQCYQCMRNLQMRFLSTPENFDNLFSLPLDHSWSSQFLSFSYGLWYNAIVLSSCKLLDESYCC